MSERILVVEDDPSISDSVAYALRAAGYEVESVGDGDTALREARSRPYDLMILDLLLPGTSGLDVCRQLRDEGDLPIVILTARDAEIDRVVGLEIGADDYVTKPFSVAELVSRARAILRRRALDRERGSSLRRVGGLELDVARHTARADGKPVHLTRSEFRLLALLATSPGQVFDRKELVRHLWDSDYAADARSIDVHVSNLRRKIEPNPKRPRRLVTVRNAGYRLDPV